MVMVQKGLGVIETFFGRNRAQAKATDVFDAAGFDQVGDDVEGFVQILALFRFEIGNRPEELSEAGDFDGQTFQKLLGAEVEVNISAGIELRSDLLEAGFFSRNRGGVRDGGGNTRGGRGNDRGRRSGLLLYGRRFIFLAAIERDEREQTESKGNGGGGFHFK